MSILSFFLLKTIFLVLLILFSVYVFAAEEGTESPSTGLVVKSHCGNAGKRT